MSYKMKLFPRKGRKYCMKTTKWYSTSFSPFATMSEKCF